MNSILSDPGRLRFLTADFVEHYDTRVKGGSSVCGKTMFVCSSRDIAYALYQ
jgi:type I restriction enzyme R subunit